MSLLPEPKRDYDVVVPDLPDQDEEPDEDIYTEALTRILREWPGQG